MSKKFDGEDKCILQHPQVKESVLLQAKAKVGAEKNDAYKSLQMKADRRHGSMMIGT